MNLHMGSHFRTQPCFVCGGRGGMRSTLIPIIKWGVLFSRSNIFWTLFIANCFLVFYDNLPTYKILRGLSPWDVNQWQESKAPFDHSGAHSAQSLEYIFGESAVRHHPCELVWALVTQKARWSRWCRNMLLGLFSHIFATILWCQLPALWVWLRFSAWSNQHGRMIRNYFCLSLDLSDAREYK